MRTPFSQWEAVISYDKYTTYPNAINQNMFIPFR